MFTDDILDYVNMFCHQLYLFYCIFKHTFIFSITFLSFLFFVCINLNL